MDPKVDAKDKKILWWLDINARQSNNAIAKRVGLSKDAVGYRIKRLENEKVILGYYSLLNIAKLGFMTYKFMLSFRNTTSAIEDEIISYLRKSRHIGWLVSSDGHYSLMAVAWVKNAVVFDGFFTDFLKKYSENIGDRAIIVITENHACRKAYLFGKQYDDTPDTYYSGEPSSELDETDISVVNALANNSRITLQDIAKSLKLTAEAIAYRIKQLKKNGVIQAFRPIINTPLLGYQYYNVLFRLKAFDNIKKMFNFFKRQPNIIYFVKYSGNYDIGIDVEVKNADELRRILQQIKDIFSKDIESYTSVLIYQEHKLSYFPESYR